MTAAERVIPIEAPTQCAHWYPRKGRQCTANVDYVLDYGSGVGACIEHVGALVRWCLEDSPHVMAFTATHWEWKVEYGQ